MFRQEGGVNQSQWIELILFSPGFIQTKQSKISASINSWRTVRLVIQVGFEFAFSAKADSVWPDSQISALHFADSQESFCWFVPKTNLDNSCSRVPNLEDLAKAGVSTILWSPRCQDGSPPIICMKAPNFRFVTSKFWSDRHDSALPAKSCPLKGTYNIAWGKVAFWGISYALF